MGVGPVSESRRSSTIGSVEWPLSVIVLRNSFLAGPSTDLLHIIEGVRDAGAGFRSITEAVDTTTSAGRMVMQMLGSFAEFERSMVRERTHAGLAAARERGARVGRPAKLSHRQQDFRCSQRLLP